MSEKQIYIHIGMPRAGSTFLQEVVFPKLDKSKICSQPKEIKDNVIPKFVRRIWVKGYYTDNELVEFQTEFLEVINKIKEDKILISQEALGGFDFQAGRGNLDIILKALKLTVPNAKIIIVLRNQIAWMKSLYFLANKQGYYTNFDKFIRANSNYWNIDVNTIKHQTLFNKVTHYFENVYAIRFELIKEDFNSYIKIFENILGVSVVGKLDKSPVNKGLLESQLAFIGKLGSLTRYDRLWKEKYTFIPRHFNTSLRSKGSLYSKFKYLTFNLLRYGVFFTGKLVGSILLNRKLVNKKLYEELNNMYEQPNQKFWGSNNLIKYK